MPTDDQRIRAGLKFLASADRDAKKAAVILDQIFGGTLPDLTIKRRHFDVTTGPGRTKRYHGRMTQDQFAVLDKSSNKKSLGAFADAVDGLLVIVDADTGQAIDLLLKALAGTKAALRSVSFPRLGTCTFDDGQTARTTQIVCEGGLLGTWVPD